MMCNGCKATQSIRDKNKVDLDKNKSGSRWRKIQGITDSKREETKEIV
jgi:hypothetical protein